MPPEFHHRIISITVAAALPRGAATWGVRFALPWAARLHFCGAAGGPLKTGRLRPQIHRPALRALAAQKSERSHYPILTLGLCSSLLRERFRIAFIGGLEFSAAGIDYTKVSSMEASTRILPIAAVLALLVSSAAVAQSDAPKGYIGAYGPDAPNKPSGGPVPEVGKVGPTESQQK